MRERMIREIMAEVAGGAGIDARELELAVRRVASRYEVRKRGLRETEGGAANGSCAALSGGEAAGGSVGEDASVL